MNMSDNRCYLREEQEKQRQRSILQAQDQLQQKKVENIELSRQLQLAQTEQEKRTYTFRIKRNESISMKILSRLKSLGVQEKRGRPKKAEGEHYQEQRKKFTAHLQPDSVDYLKALKAAGTISNISAFLDELIAEHQKKNS